MKRIIAATMALAMTAGAGVASAQPRDDHHDQGPAQARDDHGPQQAQHHWAKGQRMAHEDWDRGQHIDYREHHLRAPPRGYEWRQVDGNFILAAAATGVIASIIANAH